MKEIIEAFVARIKSPVFGYFILAWMAINWKPLFILFFDNNPVNKRIELFQELSSIYTLGVIPLGVAVVLSILYPWINYVFLWICRIPTDLRNSIQAESEHKLLLKKQELEEARRLVLATKERDLIDRAKRDEEIESISDETTKEQLKDEITKLRKLLDSSNDLGQKEKEIRIKEFRNRYQNLYKGHGGNFLKHLIPSGINLLKNDDEIEEALNSLNKIYATHPLRNWDSEIKKIGYSKFFRHAVRKNISELNKGSMDILINELKKEK